MFVSLRKLCLFALSLLCDRAIALDCGFPGEPVHGRNNLTRDVAGQFPPGTVVSYHCNGPQYVLRGAVLPRTCQEIGKWSHSRPWCDNNVALGVNVTFIDSQGERVETSVTNGHVDHSKDRNCPSLRPGNNSRIQMDLANTSVVSSVILHLRGQVKEGRIFVDDQECRESRRANHTITFECPSSDGTSSLGRHVRYQYAGNYTLTMCQLEVYRTPDNCGKPEIPANGRVIVSKSRFKSIRYDCNEGFQLVGDHKRICRGTRWHGLQPVCEPAASTDPSSTKQGPNNAIGTVIGIVGGIIGTLVLFFGFALAYKMWRNLKSRTGARGTDYFLFSLGNNDL